MIRLFIAIDIPDTIRREVAGMGRTIPKARVVREEQLHLTLKFIGEVESSRLLDIDEVLAEIFFPRFSLSLKGVGTFPPRGKPRVLWAGVEKTEQAVALRNSIERELAAAGIPREGKKYRPHLTLARLRNCPVRELQQFLAGNAFFHSSEFEVDSFQLYSSILTQRGARHRVERSYQLS